MYFFSENKGSKQPLLEERRGPHKFIKQIQLMIYSIVPIHVDNVYFYMSVKAHKNTFIHVFE